MATKKIPALKQFAGLWTLTHQPDIDNPKKEWSLEEKFKQAKKAGFDAIGGGADPALVPLAKKYGMELVIYIDSNAKTYKDRLDAAAKCNPSRVNVQMCDHDTLPKDAVKVWLAMMEYAKKIGLEDKIDLEVHRDTCTETPEKTYEIAKLYRKKPAKKSRCASTSPTSPWSSTSIPLTKTVCSSNASTSRKMRASFTCVLSMGTIARFL
ncbi:hypothetical protein QQ056_13310 [Oscillatoria laete-virens NRMC-F 0139]|nr:hypothetical protein [Oscillatoria laete-virens]MDL5054517.1 hypothetical protein [Oscillatoria laete-virens NRMC-F 0139]